MANFSAEDVQKFLDVLKAMNGIHPWIGTAVALIGLVVGAVTAYNTIKTLLNTAANDKTAKLLSSHEEKIKTHTTRMDEHEIAMKALKEDATKEITAAAAKVTDAIIMTQAALKTEIDKVKLFEMKVLKSAESPLSMIPGIQLAIEREQKRVDEILNILTKGKKQ